MASKAKKQKMQHGAEVPICPTGLAFFVRVYRGHKGKFGHEFDEVLFKEGRPSSCTHKNTTGKGKGFEQTVKLSTGVQATIESSIETSGLLNCSSQAWPQRIVKGNKLALEIKLGDKNVMLEMAEPESLSTAGLPADQVAFLEVSRSLRALAHELETASKGDPFAGALATAKTILWVPTAGALARLPGAEPAAAASSDVGSVASAVQSEAVSLAATDTFSVHSTYHSRERMEQRSITKRDLQRAVKYAAHLAVPGKPSSSGQPTLLIEYEGVVYCTDLTKKVAITAWRADDGKKEALLNEPLSIDDESLDE